MSARPVSPRLAALVGAIAVLIFGASPSNAQAWYLSWKAHENAMAPGNNFTVTWGGLSTPTKSDWIGMYKQGSPIDNKYLTYVWTDGAAGGTKIMTIPRSAPVGNYELRLISAGKYVGSTLLYVSHPGTGSGVWGNSCTPAGTYGAVRWTSIPAPSSSDWIGLYRQGAPDNQYLSYTFTYGAKAGDAKIWQPQGLQRGWYEVRLFTFGSFTMMDKGEFSIC